MKRVLLLSVTFFSVYVLVLGAFQLLGLDKLANGISMAVARGVVAGLSDRELEAKSEDGTIWFQVRERTKVPVTEEVAERIREQRRAEGFEVEKVMRTAVIVHDVSVREANVNTAMPMFIAVVIALARKRRGRMALVLGVGCAILTLLDGLSLAALIWQDPGSRLPENAVYHVLKLISVWTEGGWLMAPPFIGALIAWTWLAETPTDAAATDDGAAGRARA